MNIRASTVPFLLDALISQSGLFSKVVNAITDRFKAAKKQITAFKQFIPHHVQRPEASIRQSRPGPS